MQNEANNHVAEGAKKFLDEIMHFWSFVPKIPKLYYLLNIIIYLQYILNYL